MHGAVDTYATAFNENTLLTDDLQHPRYFEETAELVRRLSQFDNELKVATQELYNRIQQQVASSPALPQDTLDVESPHMILVYVSRHHGAVTSVRTLYVLNHKTSVGITLQDHYLGNPAALSALFKTDEPAIEALEQNHRHIIRVSELSHSEHVAQMSYDRITALNEAIDTVPHIVLGMDEIDDLRNLYVSFSGAVPCPESIRRGDLRALYRSAKGKFVLSTQPAMADLGNILHPEFTMGAALNVLNDKGFDTYKNNLLAWQKKEKKRGREESPEWHHRAVPSGVAKPPV